MFGMPGPTEMIIIGVIVLLLFGKRLPGAMRALGQSIVEFKKGANENVTDAREQEESGNATPSQR